MPYASINGESIYFEDTGSTQPVVIFCHGLLMDSEMFAPQIQALRHRYRCISWDQRGHGRTAGEVLAPFTYYDSARDLAGLMDLLGIERAILVGMSQGGFVSLRFALTYPSRVQALVLIGTQAGVTPTERPPGLMPVIEQWIALDFPEQLAREFEGVVFGPRWPGAATWKAKWKTWLPVNLRGCFSVLANRDDITDRMGEIRVPALVIHGDNDTSVSLERGRTLKRLLANARMVVIKGGGHAPNLTHAGWVNLEIANFLQRLPT